MKIELLRKPFTSLLVFSFLFGNTSLYVAASDISGVTPVGNVYNIEGQKFSGNTQFRHYENFNLTQGDIANLIYKIGYENFINLVNNEVNINGILNTMQGNNFYNGHAIFVSPEGMVVGASGVLNVGSLSVLTPSETKYNSFLDGYNKPGADLSKYIYNSDNYKGLIQDSQGNVIINGMILARKEVNLYGNIITVEKGEESPENIGIISGWQDTNTKFTDAETAKNVFNALVSNNITDVTKFALKDGKIQIVAQDDDEAEVSISEANISANSIDISAKAEYTDKNVVSDELSAEITLEDSNIVANSVKISSSAKQERKIKPEEIKKETESGIAGEANSDIEIDGTKITTTSTNAPEENSNSVIITSNADSVTNQNVTLLDSIILDFILDDDARIDEYFSDGVYNGFQGARSSSEINISNYSEITTEANATIISTANADLTISSTADKSAGSLSLFGLGTSTVSKAIIEDSTIKAKEDVAVRAFSSNNNSIDISNAAELKQKEKNPFAIDILNNTIKTDTQALISESSVNAKNLEAMAVNYSTSNSNVSMSSVGKAGGSFWANSLSLIGVLNRSDNKVSALIEESSVETTENVNVLAQSVNTVRNVASSNSSPNKIEDKKELTDKQQDKIKKTLNEKVNKKLAKKIKDNGGVNPAEGSPIFTASGIFSWNKTINSANAEIKNSTIKAENDVTVQANTVDITANKVSASGGAKNADGAKFAAGLTVIYNDQQNNTNAKITESEITSNSLNVNATTELPINSGKLEFEMTMPLSLGDESYLAYFIDDDDDKWEAEPDIPTATNTLPAYTLKLEEAFEKKPDFIFNNLAQSKSSGNSADVTGAVIYNSVKNTTEALISDASVINTQGDVVLNAVNSVIGYNAAGLADDLLVNPDEQNGDPAFGLGVNFLWDVYENNAISKIDNSKVNSEDGDVNVVSATEQAFLSVATTGGKSKVLQVDGSVAVQKLTGKTTAEISNSSTVNADNVNVNAGKADVKLTEGKIEKTDKGDLSFQEEEEATEQISNIRTIGAWRAQEESSNASDKVAVGASVNVETNEREINSIIKDSIVEAQSDLNVIADAYSQNLDVIVATAFSGGLKEQQNAAGKVKDAAKQAQEPDDLIAMFKGLFEKDKNPLGDSTKPLNNSFSLSVAGAVGVKNDLSKIGSSIIKSNITSGEQINVTSNNEVRKIQSTGTLGKTTRVGAGAAVGIYRQNSKVFALVDGGKISYVDSDDETLNVKATNEATILDISIGSGSAGSSSFAATAGGSLIYNTLSSDINSKVINTVVEAEDAEIKTNIIANGKNCLTDIAGSAVYAKGKDLGIGAGLAMAYNNVRNTIGAYLENSTLNNIGSLKLDADNNVNISDYTVAGVLIGGKTGVEFNGSSGVDFIHNNVYSRVINSSVSAEDDVSIRANSETKNKNLAGTLDINNAKKGLGVNGDVVVNVHKNNVEATVDKSSKFTESNKVDVVANTKEITTITPIGTGIAVGGNNMAAANVIVSDVNNTTKAIVFGEINANDNLTVSALDETWLYERGGNLAVTVGGKVNIGGIVDVDSFRKTVESKVQDATVSAKDVFVSASSINSIGGTKKGDGTYDILDITSDNFAELLLNENEDGLKASSAFKNWNMLYDLDFGSKLALSGTVIVKNITNTVNANVSNSKISSKNLSVLADDYSIKNIIAGEIDVSSRGDINGTVLITKDTSILNAIIDNNSNIDLENDLNLKAVNRKDNIEVVVGAGGAKVVAAHSNVVTNNSNDTVIAKIANSTISAENSINVKALNDVNATRVLFTGGGGANVAINVEPLINNYTGTTSASIIFSELNDGAINLQGHDSVTSLDIVSGISGVMQGFAGNGITIKNVYNNNISSYIDNSKIDTEKNIDVTTDSILKGNNWTITAGFAVKGVEFNANVILNNIKSKISSYILNSEISNAGSINVTANKDKKDEIKNTTGTGTLGGVGVAAEANVIYNLAKENNVQAYIDNTQIDEAGSLNIGAYADRLILNKNVGVAVQGKGAGIAVNTIVDEFDSNIHSYIDVKEQQMNVGDVNVTANDVFRAYNNIVTVAAGVIGAGAMGNVDIENSNSIVKAEIISAASGVLNANSVNVLANDTYALGDSVVGVSVGAGSVAGNVTLINIGKRTNKEYSKTEQKSQVQEAINQTSDIYAKRIGDGAYTPTSTPESLKTGAIARINGNVTSQNDINIQSTNSLKGLESGSYKLKDTLNLQNVQVQAGLGAAGVGIKRIKLANNTYAGITNGNVTTENGSINVKATAKNDINIKNVEVRVSGLNISGSSGIYNNVSETTAEVKDSKLSAEKNINVQTNSNSKSTIDGTSVIVAGTNIAGVSISDNTLKNTSVAKISGNTNIEAGGKLSVHSTADSDLSSVLRTVVVSGVKAFGMIRNFSDVQSKNSAVIENVNGTFNVGNLDVISDSNVMKSYARTNLVSVTGATVGATDSNGAYMTANMTAGIESLSGLTINNDGTTTILSGVKANDVTKAIDFNADSRISSTSVAVGQLYGTALAFAENNATVTAKLNVKEHNANNLNLNAYLNESGTATFTDTSVKLLSINSIEANTNFKGNLNISLAGNNNIIGNSVISAIHNATSDVNLYAVDVGGVNISIPKIFATVNSSTNVTLSGILNSGNGTTVNSYTTRNSKLNLTSKAGGLLKAKVATAGNNIGGVSTLNISGLKSDEDKNNNLNISHKAQNTHNTITYSASGSLINVDVTKVESKLESKLDANIKDNTDIKSNGTFKLEVKNDNVMQAGATGKSGGFIAVQKDTHNSTYNSNADLTIKNSNILAKNVELSTNSTFRTYSDNPSSPEYLTYVVKNGGFVATNSLKITNTINQTSIANVIDSVIQADENINVAVNTNTLFRQKSETSAKGAVGVTSNISKLNVNNTEKLLLSGTSKIIAGKDVNVNLDSNNNLEAWVHAYKASGGGKATAESYVIATINNEIMMKDGSELIGAGSNINLNFMTKSNSTLTQYAYAETHGVIGIVGINGILEERYNNKINLNNENTTILAGRDVTLNYSTGKVNRDSKILGVGRAIGIPVKKSRSYYSLYIDDQLNLNGKIIAGDGNNKYMFIKRDGTVDETKTKGFSKSEYQLVNDGIVITPEEQRQYNLALIDEETKNVQQKIDELDKDIDDTTAAIVTFDSKKMALQNVIDNAPKEMKHYSEAVNIIKDDMKSAGIKAEYVDIAIDGYVAALKENPDINFEQFIATIPDNIIPAAVKAELIPAAKIEFSRIETNDYYTTFDNEFIVTVYEDEAFADTTLVAPQLYDPLAIIKSDVDNLNFIIMDLEKVKAEDEAQKTTYVAEKTNLLNLRKEVEQKKYETIKTSDSIVFKSPIIINNNGKITVNNLRSFFVENKKYYTDKKQQHARWESTRKLITAGEGKTGSFNINSTAGLKIDNYSSRDIVFLGDINIAKGGSGLYIGGKDFNEFLNQPKIINSYSTDLYMWRGVKDEWKKIKKPPGVIYKSINPSSVIELTINDYFDAFDPMGKNQGEADIVFHGNVISGNILKLWTESGDIKFLKGYFANGITDIIATQGSVVVEQNGDLRIKNTDTIVGAKSVELTANNIINDGKIYTGYADRTLTITDAMLANLIVDPTTGETNMINLGGKISPYLNNTNNIKALYKDGKILLFDVDLENYGNLILKPKNTYSGEPGNLQNFNL